MPINISMLIHIAGDSIELPDMKVSKISRGILRVNEARMPFTKPDTSISNPTTRRNSRKRYIKNTIISITLPATAPNKPIEGVNMITVTPSAHNEAKDAFTNIFVFPIDFNVDPIIILKAVNIDEIDRIANGMLPTV